MAGEENLPTKLPAGQVAVRAADGTAGLVDASQLQEMLDGGGELVTPEQIAEAKTRAQYSTPGMAALAAGGGVASTLSLGVSDQIAKHVGATDYLNAAKYNPTARLLGEGAGFVAPWAAEGLAERTGIEGLEALGGAPSLLSRAGRATEEGVSAGADVARAALTDAAPGLATQALTDALSKGAGYGLEGALYGVGNTLSENAIEEPPTSGLTSDKIFAGLEKGALFAGGLGVAGGLLKGGGKGLASLIGTSSLGARAEEKAGEIAWRSAGATKKMAQGAEHFAAGPAEVGKIWIREAPELAGEANFRSMSREKLAEAATKGQAKYGNDLGTILGETDAIATKRGALPLVADVRSDIYKIIGELDQQIGTAPAIAKLQGFADDMGRIGGLTDVLGNVVNADARATYTQIRDWRRAADNAWAGNSVDPSLFGFKKVFYDARGALEKRVLDGVAANAGKESAEAYQAAKAKFQAFKILEKASDSGVAAKANNRAVSLTDTLSGNAGAVVGSVLGGPVGSVVGGALSAGANHLLRTKGDFYAADILSRLSKLDAIANVSARTDARIAGRASSFVHSTERERAAIRPTLTHAEYSHIAGALQEAVANPTTLQPKLAKLTEGIAHVAPSTAQAVSTKATAGLMFLASKLPTAHAGSGNLLQIGKISAQKPSDLELETFSRYLHAFEDPESVLDDLHAGRITREGVETVENVYPPIFEKMQNEIRAEAAQPTAPELSYSKLVQLGVLFKMPTTEFLQPDVLNDIQNTYSTPEANQEGGAGSDQGLSTTPKRPLDISSKDMQSQAQQSAEPR